MKSYKIQCALCDISVPVPWLAFCAPKQVEPKAWDLSSTEQEADWGSSFDNEGWSFAPANTAITGFRRSHDNNLFNLEARFFGIAGWLVYILFCVDGCISRFFSRWERDYWWDLKQTMGYVQIQRDYFTHLLDLVINGGPDKTRELGDGFVSKRLHAGSTAMK